LIGNEFSTLRGPARWRGLDADCGDRLAFGTIAFSAHQTKLNTSA